MSEKIEMRAKMAQLHKEYQALASQLKKIEDAERAQQFKDFIYKTFISGIFVESPNFEEVTDEDRAHAKYSEKTNIAFSHGFKDGVYLLLKSKEDYPRIKILYDRIAAVQALEDKGTQDKTPYIKIILGE